MEVNHKADPKLQSDAGMVQRYSGTNPAQEAPQQDELRLKVR